MKLCIILTTCKVESALIHAVVSGVVFPISEDTGFAVRATSDFGHEGELATDLPPPVEYPVPSTDQIRILLALWVFTLHSMCYTIGICTCHCSDVLMLCVQ